MQLIYSNLRGPDSKVPFFRSLPQVFVIPYQGSESSTSDGIIKVFNKANKYLDKNKVPSRVLNIKLFTVQIGCNSSGLIG